MSKAIFTAEQLETLLSRVLATAIDKFDACLEKMTDKFESRLAKVYELMCDYCHVPNIASRDYPTNPFTQVSTSV